MPKRSFSDFWIDDQKSKNLRNLSLKKKIKEEFKLHNVSFLRDTDNAHKGIADFILHMKVNSQERFLGLFKTLGMVIPKE